MLSAFGGHLRRESGPRLSNRTYDNVFRGHREVKSRLGYRMSSLNDDLDHARARSLLRELL